MTISVIVRELNEGVKRIYLEMQSMGLPEPEFIETEQNFKVTLRNNIAERMSHISPESEVKSAEKSAGKKQKTAEKIKDLMRQSPEITTIELAEHLGITQSGIEKQISKMKKSGDITRKGGDKGGNWIVLK